MLCKQFYTFPFIFCAGNRSYKQVQITTIKLWNTESVGIACRWWVRRPVLPWFLSNQWRNLNLLLISGVESLFGFPLLGEDLPGETPTILPNSGGVHSVVPILSTSVCRNWNIHLITRRILWRKWGISMKCWSCSSLTVSAQCLHSRVCPVTLWNHLCTCSHKLSWVVRHDMIFKNSIKSYAWKTGHSLFPGSPSSLDLVPGRMQPVRTSAPVSSHSSQRAAHAPYAGGVVKIPTAACACA